MSVSKRSFQFIAGLVLLAFTFGSLACNGGGSGTVSLQGAGATFPNPLYQKWLSEYGKLHANVRIDYQSIGSGGGIRQLLASTVDFAASDVPMTDDELARSSNGPILHIPTLVGAVVVTYNLPFITLCSQTDRPPYLLSSSRSFAPGLVTRRKII